MHLSILSVFATLSQLKKTGEILQLLSYAACRCLNWTTGSPGSSLNKFAILKLLTVYDTFVSYLLHLSTVVLCLIDFCFALHNCSNEKVRHEVICSHPYVWLQGVKVIFKLNSISIVLSLLAIRHPSSKIHKSTCKLLHIEI